MLCIAGMSNMLDAAAQSDASYSNIIEDADDGQRQQEEVDQTTNIYGAPNIPVGSSGDNDANPPELGGGDPGAPIDGGLSVLLAAGAAYGVKRMRKGKDDRQQSKNHS